MGRLLLALVVMLVAAPQAHASSCVPDHPAVQLAQADAAIIATAVSDTGGVATFRVDRVAKGSVTEPVQMKWLPAPIGEPVVLFRFASGHWDSPCGEIAPATLLEAAKLAPPDVRGTPRLLAAASLPGADVVALDARGRP